MSDLSPGCVGNLFVIGIYLEIILTFQMVIQTVHIAQGAWEKIHF